jgi:hypothetical protein
MRKLRAPIPHSPVNHSIARLTQVPCRVLPALSIWKLFSNSSFKNPE